MLCLKGIRDLFRYVIVMHITISYDRNKNSKLISWIKRKTFHNSIDTSNLIKIIQKIIKIILYYFFQNYIFINKVLKFIYFFIFN